MEIGWSWGIVFAVAMGLWTLFPDSTASKVCFLGYRAHCSFTPISTAICWLIAGIVYGCSRWFARKKKVN